MFKKVKSIGASLSKYRKGFSKSKVRKWISVAAVSSFIAVMGCVTCFAADGETQTTQGSAVVAEALRTALNNMLTDFFTYAGIVLPIGFTIFGVMIGIAYATKLFKKVSK